MEGLNKYRHAYTEILRLCRQEDRLKSSYNDVISAVNNFLYQWDPRTVMWMEEMCGPQGELNRK